MKKQLLKKMAKAASVALVAGAMVCGAGLTDVNAQSVKPSNNDAKAEYQMTKPGLLGGARKGVKANKKSSKKNKKNIRKNVKRTKKSVKKNNRKARKSTKKVVRRHASKRSIARRNAVRRANLAKREARQALRRRAAKPTNRRALKNYRHSRSYYNVWSNAKKVNVRAVKWNEAKINKLNKANSSKHLTKYEHKALKRDIKAVQKHAAYMQKKYVDHDDYMLSLAK